MRRPTQMILIAAVLGLCAGRARGQEPGATPEDLACGASPTGACWVHYNVCRPVPSSTCTGLISYQGDGTWQCRPQSCFIPVTRIQPSQATYDCTAPAPVHFDLTTAAWSSTSYEWLLDGSRTGVTGPRFDVPAGLAPGTHCIRLLATRVVTNYNCNGPMRSLSAGATLVVVGQPVTIASDDPLVYACGSVRSARLRLVDGPPDATAYQWYGDGQPIAGATAPTYHTPTDLGVGGHHFALEVSAEHSCVGRSAELALQVTGEPVEIDADGPLVQSSCEGLRPVHLRLKSAPAGAELQWFEGRSPLPGATASTFDTPTDLAPGDHAFLLEATYLGGCRSYSDPIVIRVLGDVSAVSRLQAARSGDDVVLAWEPAAAPAQGYRVYRMNDKTLVALARQPVPPGVDCIHFGWDPRATQLVDPGAAAGLAGDVAFYQVRAVSEAGRCEGP